MLISHDIIGISSTIQRILEIQGITVFIPTLSKVYY